MDRRLFLYTLASPVYLSTFDTWAQNNLFSQNELIGKKRPALSGINTRLRKNASVQFDKMVVKANKKGIKLFSVSSYRSFSKQVLLWNTKYDKFHSQGLSGKEIVNKIIEYSALPGASRHHWGTDLDVSDLAVIQPRDPLNQNHFKKGGVYSNIYDWMVENANQFGFYEVYTNDIERKGFKYEPWHFSYADISVKMLHEFQQLDLLQLLPDKQIKGYRHFDESFLKKYVSEYVNGINPKLL